MNRAACGSCGREATQGAAFCPHCGSALTSDLDGAAQLQPGAVLGGKFRIGRELGRGAFGVVYEAHDTVLDRPVALKAVRPDAVEDEAERAVFAHRFLREARSAARLHHPNVIAVFEAGQDRGLMYMVMELVPGTTLRRMLNLRGRLPAAEVMPIAAALLDALHDAHVQGIVHRDIKPENVMVTPAGKVKVADFGIAKVLHAGAPDITRQGAVLGTPSYMAPEQIKGLPVDGRADMFAAAATIYEALSGTKPFQARSANGLLWSILHEMPRPLPELVPGIPEAVDAAVQRALAKDADGRYATCDAFRRALAGEIDTLSTDGGHAVPAADPSRAVPAGLDETDTTVAIPAPASTELPVADASPARPRRAPVAGVVAVVLGSLLFLGAVGALVVVLGGDGTAPPPVASSRTYTNAAGKREVLAALQELGGALAARDAARIAAAHAPDGRLHARGVTHDGPRRIAAFHRDELSRHLRSSRVEVQVDPKDVTVRGDAAGARFTVRVLLPGGGASTATFDARLARRGGRWLIIECVER